MTIEERIRGRKIGVIGMARSGMAAARLAQALGGQPFVSDSGSETSLAKQIAELSAHDIPYETGAHSSRLLISDYLVVSPGVPLSAAVIQQAKAQGLPVFSELEFASWVCPGKIVAITGSNGKTTTTTLVGELLAAGKLDTHVCGNIGTPLADVVGRMNSNSVAVVEVSSFQLEAIDSFRPHVAVILNLTPDHVDRHGSFENYKQAKYRITENQRAADFFITNRDDAETVADHPGTRAKHICFSAGARRECGSWVETNALWTRRIEADERVIACDDIGIKGPHNLQNAAAAVTVAARFGLEPSIMQRVLRQFAGVEHRLEPVATVAGVSFINDSKATNVDSVYYALKSVPTPLYLICGGRDKNGVFEPLIEAGRGRIKGLIIIGEAREKLFEVLGKHFPAQFASSLEAAVEKGFELARPGETVLLSPGCASFDMFDNYEHRGRAFKAAVARLRNGKTTDESVSS
ncbi:MAG: UDP-N-acetylmuramoyl-L-alanine--D-glutamate ligase [candidate division Zixibacteria bacterium]|nr:UDP-N-acetylmuramoyl-L-alanine--D-glutamate ligase [candidate division Zixibacteria bacterium]